MMFAADQPDLLTWLMDLIQMKRDVVTQGLWVGTVLSAVYFLVMLFTRWGDRHTLAKALVFSGLIHLISVGGLVAVVSTPDHPHTSLPPTKDEEEPATTVELFSEDPQELPNEGNTPIWDRLPDPVETLMVRNDQQNVEPIPLEDPDRQIAPPQETETPVPDLPPTLPDARARCAKTRPRGATAHAARPGKL